MSVFSEEEKLRLMQAQQMRLKLNQIPEQPAVLDMRRAYLRESDGYRVRILRQRVSDEG